MSEGCCNGAVARPVSTTCCTGGFIAPPAQHIAVSLWLTGKSRINSLEAAPPIMRRSLTNMKYGLRGKPEAFRSVLRQRRKPRSTLFST